MRYDGFGASIIDDLWNKFINLDSQSLRYFFMKYYKKYGKEAFDYALKTYPKWRSREVNPASSTKERLIVILPEVLPTKDRIRLLKKMFSKELRPKYEHKSDYSLTTSWDNYINDISSIKKEIYNDRNSYEVKQPQLTEGMARNMRWLFENDMQIANSILINYCLQRAYQDFDNAINSFDDFLDKCGVLYRNDEIYADVRMTINTPSRDYRILINPKRKSILKKLKFMF